MNFLRNLLTLITGPIEFIQNHFKATVLVLIVFFIYQSSNSEDLITPNLKNDPPKWSYYGCKFNFRRDRNCKN